MSHFAKVVDGKVTQVIVAEKEFFDTLFSTWKPREKFEFINTNEVKDRVLNHKLLY